MTTPADSSRDPIFQGEFQARFLLLLSFVFVFGAFFLFVVLFATFSRPIPGDYASVFYALRHLSAFILPVIGLAVLAYVLLVCAVNAVLCILAMHKIAGPLYRMDRVIDAFTAGEPVGRVAVRDGDQGWALAEAFNGFTARLRDDLRAAAAAMAAADAGPFPDAAAQRAAMKESLGRVEALLEKYR